MTPEEYVEFFRNGQKAKVSGLCGRVLRGKTEDDFVSLSDNPDRQLVMIMGADGLEKMLGKNGYEMLLMLGYLPEFIRQEIEKGTKFKFFVSPKFDGFRPATWDKVIELASIQYLYAGPRLRAVLPQLKKLQYEQIEGLLGYRLGEVFHNGKSDPRFITYKRFLKTELSVGSARAFLYHSCFLYELFTGNGYTKIHGNGRRGIKEYVGRNCRLDVFQNHQLIDLNVVLP